METTRARPPLLNPAEAARILGLKPNTLAKYRMNLSGPPFVRLVGRIRYDLATLEKYIAELSVRTDTSQD